MKLPFLRYDIEKSFIDNKEEMLKALTEQDWTIVDIIGDKVDLKSDKGFWLSNIPLYLFSKNSLAEHIVELNERTQER